MTTRTEPESQRGREIDRDAWQPFFDELNRSLMRGATLEAIVALVGDRAVGPEAEHLPLNSITYEDRDDQIAIGLGGRGERFPAVLWHFVDRPRRVWVREEAGRPALITVESEDGTVTRVLLRAV